MSDYRVEIKVRNANILRIMEERGIGSVAELCRNTGVSQTAFGDIINLKLAPVNRRGEWHPSVRKVCEYLFVMPADLFSEEQMTPLEKNKSTIDVNFDEISVMLTDQSQDPLIAIENKTKNDFVNDTINHLPERQRRIMSLRYGLDGAEHTLSEIAEIEGISGNRVRQIEMQVLRKLRHPSIGLKQHHAD
jgi:DNA-directed RNA polymerase sigma subunit (sigma70/sigma32)